MMAPYTLLTLAEMLELPIGTLISTYSRLYRVFQYVGVLRPDLHPAFPLSEFDALTNDANEFLMACRGMGLTTTESAATALCATLKKGERSDDQVHFRGSAQMHFKGCLSAVFTCFENESPTKVALILPSEKVRYFSPPSPLFGDDTHEKFPKTSYEIAEAGKCLALGRSTAAVFHLMRVLESGLRAIHQCLGIDVNLEGNNRNWGSILKRIREETHRRGAAWTEQQYFKELYARLDAIKDVWRNETMHIESVYTEEQALDVFNTTRSFMQKIAARMNEQGNPVA